MDSIVMKQFAIELRNLDEGDFFEDLVGRLEAFAIFPTEKEAREVFKQLRAQYALPKSEEGYVPFVVYLMDYAQDVYLEGGLPMDRFITDSEGAEAIKEVLKRALVANQ